MRTLKKISAGILAASVAFTIVNQPSFAEDSSLVVNARGGGKPSGGGGGGGGGSGGGLPKMQPWMSPEVGLAWSDGFLGEGASITVIDDFNSRTRLAAILDGRAKLYRHGELTSKMASLVAPSATMFTHDFISDGAVTLKPGTFNVLNVSYAWEESATWNAPFDPQEQSIIDFALNGSAFVSKSAGNNSVAIGGTYGNGLKDFLAPALVGPNSSAIIVGALDTNGTVDSKASLASYSNFAGTNLNVQNQFLVVGVLGTETGVYGTSFAAPIISGYGAMLSKKFGSANADPKTVANRLLDTARKDTLVNIGAAGWDEADAAKYGRGEASIARAIAPDKIN